MKLTELARDLNIRFDLKAIRLFSTSDRSLDDTVPLQAIAKVRELTPCQKPEERFRYHEISSIDEFGLGEPFLIEEENVEQGSEEERILQKVNKGDIVLPLPGTILIPKVRPNLGKFVLTRENDNTYYTSAFLEATPKTISAELLYCILKHPNVLKQIFDISRIGKGYPTISAFDLTRFVRVPKRLLNVQQQLDLKIGEEVDRLFSTLSNLRKEREIIDNAFQDYFPELKEIAKHFNANHFSYLRSDMGLSFDIRMSAHFVRPALKHTLSNIMYKDTVKIIRLCSIPISLGVSPELFLEESDYYYLGPQAMMTERFEPSKLSMISEEFYNIKEPLFGTKYGDVFLRRSGASLGKVLYYDGNLLCIFSDFMMRLRFRDPLIAKYAAHWMRCAAFQRLVGIMAVIGKGLRNIYPYQVGVMPIPYPDKKIISEIVDAIDNEIELNDRVQVEIRKKIMSLQEFLSSELSFGTLYA